MSLERVLAAQRDDIVQAWGKRIASGYPEGYDKLLLRGHNPVQQTLHAATAGLFDALRADAGVEALRAALDEIIHLRAVQSFTAAEAAGFVFELKPLVRKALGKQIHEKPVAKALAAYEQRVDQAALVAFDLYMGCRERLMQLRIETVRRQMRELLDQSPIPARRAATRKKTKA